MKVTNSGRGIHQREIPGIDRLKTELPDSWYAFTNLDLALPGKGVREIDLVMVIDDRVLLVDLKDWFGPVTSREGNWFNGGRDCGRSPAHKIAENVRELLPLLKRFLTDQEKKEPGLAGKLHAPWIAGVVVLTRAGDRSGISATEMASVFSVEPFIKMLRNRAERDTQLGVSPSRHTDFTTTEWNARFRRFFNTSSGIFRAGARRYGGFIARNDSPTFVHRNGIFSEFDVEEEGVAVSSGLLRRWDFTRAETRFQTEEGRAAIVGREKTVIAWLNDRSALCEAALLKPRIDDPDKGVAYWEVFERRRRLKRLSEFIDTDLKNATSNERIELARQVLSSAKSVHDLQAAHLDIGPHSVWLELPSTARLSHLMAASFPEIQTLGTARFQFLSSSTVPEEVIGESADPLRKDVFLLGCVLHILLFGVRPDGEPPEWNVSVDPDGKFSVLHSWFQRCLDMDWRQRFGNASEMLDAFNTALAVAPTAKSTIEGLERFRVLKSQRQVFQKYPESELVLENDRIVIWRSDTEDGQRIVKLWKGMALGDLTREAPRILAFLERAQSLVESPVTGTSALHAVYWTGDASVVVQDYAAGVTLAAELQSGTALTAYQRAIPFLVDLIRTVELLHDRSLAHGDLKPDNIVVAQRNELPSPVLIDLVDLGAVSDGERISSAYAPPFGGQFERDRYAVTKIAEEVLSKVSLPEDRRSSIDEAIEKCRVGPPENATLLPLLDALDRAMQAGRTPANSETIHIGIHGELNRGPLLSDEGVYGISRNGPQLFIRGAAEQLQIKLDSARRPVAAKRSRLSQSAVQSAKRHEFAFFPGNIVIEGNLNRFEEISKVLDHPDVVAGWDGRPQESKSDVPDDDTESLSTEGKSDELTERIVEHSPTGSHVRVKDLWRRMVELEAELSTEAVAIGDGGFRRASKRHVIPIQMVAGELDFDRNDVVAVERQDQKGKWSRIGTFDVAASTPDFIAVESWSDGGAPLVQGGSRLRFQSRLENTSRERRQAATDRILQGSAAARGLLEVLQPSENTVPATIVHAIDDATLSSRYELNAGQIEGFKTILGRRPLGLVQGPPGTGKTRFIGALIHYVLTRGLARNVLLASQSHEAVNNAAEAVLKLFGDDRDSLSLIRVGHEGSVSEVLKPHHVARVERAFKDRFRATAKLRLESVANSLGLSEEHSGRVRHFEDAVRPVLARIDEIEKEDPVDVAKLNALKLTVRQLMDPFGITIDDAMETAELQDEVPRLFYSSFPSEQGARISALRQVIELGRDIVGSVSTWQRSFETFLAGTRQVVAGTCVGLGRTSLGLTKTIFDLVVVDEAARCTPSELAVPMQAGKWIVLVGDHEQLEPLHRPEVVEAVSHELRLPLHEVVRSDFERVFESSYGSKAGVALTTQYRMLPAIGRVVSTFYGNKLHHGRHRPIVNLEAMPSELSKPLVWFSTDSLGPEAFQKPDKLRRGSLFNDIEAEAIVALLRRWSDDDAFLSWLGSQPDGTQSIGVICAYAAQRDLVWKRLQAENLHEIVRRAVKVDTIDSYQGKENPIVILTLVRNNAEGPLEAGFATIKPGFMARKNRVNVAMSRAMDRLVIVGARTGWRQGSPIATIVEAFAAEERLGEAVVLDANDLLQKTRTATKRKKKAVANADHGAQEDKL